MFPLLLWVLLLLLLLVLLLLQAVLFLAPAGLAHLRGGQGWACHGKAASLLLLLLQRGVGWTRTVVTRQEGWPLTSPSPPPSPPSPPGPLPPFQPSALDPSPRLPPM